MNIMLATKAGSLLGPIATFFGYIMDFLFKATSSLGIYNIGLCIILFTIITKILLFPLTIKQQESSKLMSLMNPEIQKVQKKYRGKTDQTSIQKQNAEMKAIYEKYGSNPTAGCLPLLIQLPIIFALYRIIYNIPAYVPSVYGIFERVASPLMQQSDYITRISELADSARLAVDKFDYTEINRVIDLLYKFTPANWETLRGIFPSMFTADVNSAVSQIEQMNSFLGINLASNPWQGFTKPGIAWLIPILAGLTQYASTKLMSANQPQQDSDNPMVQSMNQMVVTMPLVSVFICFTLPAAVGLYWVVQGFLTLVQQLLVNKRMENIDPDELVKRNIEKANKKRARQGLPPMNVSSDTKDSRKAIQKNEENAAREEREAVIKKARSAKQTADSDAYYKKDAKPGSLASKAGMVKKFNEKNEKRGD